MSEQPHVRLSQSDEDFKRAFEVRWKVFVEEQGVPADIESDELDPIAVHALAELDGAVVATGRLTFDEGARIGRIAVLPEHRHQGIASRILKELELVAATRGYREVTLHAQTYAQALYDKNGYAVSGPGFVEAGIDHVPMRKAI